MSGIQVLGNAMIHDLLINLSKAETREFRRVIERTFEEFSVDGERQYQPMPSVANRLNGSSILFRPFTSDSSIGTKITAEPAPRPDGTKDPLRGIIILCDGKGNPKGLLSSDEVTGYRTSMNVMVPFSWRKRVENIVIFGSGVQALWHTRLILILRGSEVKIITYVGSSRHRVEQLITTISAENDTRWKANCSFGFIENASSDYQQKLKAHLRNVDCIFCTTPSKSPLFPASYIAPRSSRGPFISAIGSWQRDMIELDPSLLSLAVAPDAGYNPITGRDEGVILVDDRDFALKNSGELVKSKTDAKNVIELGEVIALRKGKILSEYTTNMTVHKTDSFLSEGLVIYKSVGVSLTDLTVGDAVLKLARERQ